MSNRQRTAWGLPPVRRPIGSRKRHNPRLTVECLDGRILPSVSSHQFDFGTYASYNQPGYTRVTRDTAYSATTGYGWLSGNVAGTDRGSAGKDDLSFNFTADATFGVALPSGNYVVTVTANDPGAVHDLMGVSTEGQLRGWLTMTRDLREVRASYTVSVTDGMLNLRLHDLGGNDQFAVINSLEVFAAAIPPQATFAGTTATEGSPGLVTFLNPGGGTGPYTYSVDFNNDGTFEVVAGSNAAVTVPASYLPDGPGAVVVRGRITDSNGLSRDYITALAVANAPPSVTLASTMGGTLNTPVVFSATVSDPSPVDKAAGFTYAWDFGDGTGSTQATANHAYSAVGTYTARLTVRDKDGGLTTKTSTVLITQQPAPGSFIVTSNDRIPNFGAQPTITSARSGLWSDPGTWSAGRVPAAGDVVSIAAWNDVTYDLVSTEAVKTVAVQANGRLIFRTDINTRLTVINLLVMEGGELRVGTAANPVAANVKAEVIFADVALDLVNDPSQYGNGLIALGKVTVHGAVKGDSFIRLAVEPRAGDTVLTLANPTNGWRPGDRLVLPNSLQPSTNQQVDDPRNETLTIASVSADGRVLTLASPVQYNHPGARDADGNLVSMPHIIDLTRNVVIRSANANGTRGHTMFTQRADIDIRYAQFSGLGRTRIDPLNNTTYNASGAITNVGTNQTGRYSVNFSHLYGPVGGQANGHQFTFQGNSVFCPITPMPFRWGIALNDSHYGLVQNNALFNWAGAGIVAQTGNETGNVIANNIVSRITGLSARPDYNRGLREDVAFDTWAYWFRGYNNILRDNVAAGAKGYMFWAAGVTARVPVAPGADTTVAGQYSTVNMMNTPIAEFSGGEVYGTVGALQIWSLGTVSVNAYPDARTSTISGLLTWHIEGKVYYNYETNRLTFDGFRFYGNRASLNGAGRATAFYSGDYLQKDFVVRNAVIHNAFIGIMPSCQSGGGTQTFENIDLRNYYNAVLEHIYRYGARPDPGLARTSIFRNCRFTLTTTPETGFHYGPKSNFVMLDKRNADAVNFLQRDQVFVYDYNGVSGNNFQVFYRGQAADAVVPTEIRNSNGTLRVVGSPVAGLTNAQTWAQFGIAVGGEIAPATAVSQPYIIGLVNYF